MGGPIAVAARFNDGETICVEGWTNFLPNMIHNETTLSGDDSIVKADLLKAASLNVYAGPIRLAPRGYGIVIIDFVERTIHSMQGYTRMGTTYLSDLTDQKKTGWKDGVFRNVLSEGRGSLLDAGRVSIVATQGERHDPVRIDRHSALALLDEKFLMFMSGKGLSVVEMSIDMSPFVLHEYEESNTMTPIRRRLARTGFPLKKADGLNRMLAGIRDHVDPNGVNPN